MRRLALFAVLGYLGTLAGVAAQPVREEIPPVLRPWIPWVLHGSEEELCPFLSGAGSGRYCAWPGRLDLRLDERGGSFDQRWTLYAEGFVSLPGDERHWPQQVRVDGRATAPILQRASPAVYLRAGEHRLTGDFRWDSLPESLPVPPSSGIVALTLRGRSVPFPSRDEAGRLWVRRSPGSQEEEETLTVDVQRRVIDSVPLMLVTRIELAVSGRSRELALGRALPEGFIPVRLEGPLPARLESDGRLRVQARPGRWVLTLTGRHQGTVSELTLPQPQGPWAGEEVWVFEARPDLRVAEIEGVPSVDPRQTRMPEDWRMLPAFLLRPGDVMRLVERRRGDEDPAADRLSLHRVVWLDFNGEGFSVQDILQGTLSRSWRLELGPPMSLERVVVAGVDQVITQREDTPFVGVELRQGTILLAAESRVVGGSWDLPAVGWEHDFETVSGELHLPPGWRILAAFGVDRVPGTWIDRWTLLDFFVVLILALACRRLWGNLWGLLGLATFVLAYHETGAPTWIFFFVLAPEALLRSLREGRGTRLLRFWYWGALVLMLLQTVPFIVRQVRIAMYPVLEYPYSTLGQAPLSGLDFTNQASLTGFAGSFEAQRPDLLDQITQEARDEEAPLAKTQPPPPPPAPPAASAPVRVAEGRLSRLNLQELDPSLSVNTGRGLPRWSWNRVQLSWSGPVEADQWMRFLLLPPAVNFLLGMIRVFLLSLLVLRVLGLPGRFWPPALRGAGPAGAAALSVFFLLIASPTPAAAQVPSQEVLEALKQRLLEKPACYPRCAEISQLVLETAPAVLRGRLEVGAQAETALPLPGGTRQWFPAQVLVDGQTARALRGGDGSLWVVVAAGLHQVLLEGPLPDQKVVQLPLPLRPRRVEVRGTGWTVEGLREDGLADASLELIRQGTGGRRQPSDLEQTGLPPFLEIRRTLGLGLNWQVDTRVRRLSPPGSPVSVAIPLLAGEAVTSPEVRVDDGRVLVTLSSPDLETAWSARLPTGNEISLQAPDTLSWVEVWRLDASPLWHVTPQGIPPIHPLKQEPIRVPEWHPWPGETLTLAVDRPSGVEGQSQTVDGSVLSLSPGVRSSDVRLQLALRSSRGGQHTLTLPERAELQSVTIDDQSQPLRQEGAQVTFPVTPGSHKVDIAWREGQGVGLFYSTSRVDLGLAAVNAQTELTFPSNRWILALGGHGRGPAVVFWSLLAVILLIAAGLGRLPWTPLKTVHWGLLGVGLSQIPVIAGAAVAGWLLVLGLRREHGRKIPGNLHFNLVQVGLGIWTLLALCLLFWAIAQGLLGPPEMQIGGNGSSAYSLRWFSDRAGEVLPTAWVFSLPLFIYRWTMLAWALWLAAALLRWLRWGWESFTVGGGWRSS